MEKSFYVLEVYLEPGGGRECIMAVSAALSDLEKVLLCRLREDDTPYNLLIYGQGIKLSAYEKGVLVASLDLRPYLTLRIDDFDFSYSYEYEKETEDGVLYDEVDYTFPSTLIIRFEEKGETIFKDDDDTPILLPSKKQYSGQDIIEILEDYDAFYESEDHVFEVRLTERFERLMPSLQGEMIKEGEEATFKSYYFDADMSIDYGVTEEESGEHYSIEEWLSEGGERDG